MKFILRNANVVNEGVVGCADIVLADGLIERIEPVGRITANELPAVDLSGLFLFPGVIDDQVHFREPGLTHKADIHTESMAAVAGGVTSYMDMPNTKPQTTSVKLLEQKYMLATNSSFANYAFYLGATNDNIEELTNVNYNYIPGIKVFMGSSTGNMLVDNEVTLEKIFSEVNTLIAVHAEDEDVIKHNTEIIKKQYGDNPPFSVHPAIRSDEACYSCSLKAVNLAEKYGSRLHLLHLTTEKEMKLLSAKYDKAKITAEVCAQHLWFTDKDYQSKGQYIKCNPAIKTETDRNALRANLINGNINVVASDHAPHTLEEKQKPYFDCPSGMPMVQHTFHVMLELCKQGIFKLEDIPFWMSHNPAKCFNISNRGFIREGYAADLVAVDMNDVTPVNNKTYFYKCGWSPFDGFVFNSKIKYTFVNAKLVYADGKIVNSPVGERMYFENE
ncbi:MAG: dihydroorotase [Bacteroidales bacterium]|jgi:dihydroorotase|nr:dihydroorotase [Bacteroidales bacterium]MDD2204263.1 dihydroorotase [Bacteroidales bacterium]MDD3152520.1 dihydroorotase [Bacteroidales bacterium]MDD3913565.1 dihydroorotase [Bacteroidales bacterium]MDD4633667.1 dihydroorotase [Bacteroidales bacterium]